MTVRNMAMPAPREQEQGVLTLDTYGVVKLDKTDAEVIHKARVAAAAGFIAGLETPGFSVVIITQGGVGGEMVRLSTGGGGLLEVHPDEWRQALRDAIRDHKEVTCR